MKSFLYNQPPKQLKFYPLKKGVFGARGLIGVMHKEPEEGLPALEIFRFEFFLKVTDSRVIEANFNVDELKNLHRETVHSQLSWNRERKEAVEMLEHDEEDGTNLEVYDAAINYWLPTTYHTIRDIASPEILKNEFAILMEIDYVMRHYFETEWLILDGDHHISIDFKGIFSGIK